MYVANPEKLNQDKLYYCKSENIKNYLLNKGFVYLSKKNGMWIFNKTNGLLEAVKEVS